MHFTYCTKCAHCSNLTYYLLFTGGSNTLIFWLFAPSNIKLGNAFIVTLVTFVFDSFMLTLHVLNKIYLKGLPCSHTDYSHVSHLYAHSVDVILIP